MKAAELRDLGADELGAKERELDRPAVPDADPEVDGPARGAGQDANGAPRSRAVKTVLGRNEDSRSDGIGSREALPSPRCQSPIRGSYGSEI